MRFSIVSPRFLIRIYLSISVVLLIFYSYNYYLYFRLPSSNENPPKIPRKQPNSKIKFNQKQIIFDESLLNYSYFNTDFAKLDAICEGEEDARLCAKSFKKHNSQIYVVPRYKLAACLIPKNMSTMLKALMCYLLDPSNFNAKYRKFSSFSSINACHNTSISNFESYEYVKMNIQDFDQTEWKLLALFRDPVERLISTFVDLCIRQKECKLCGTNFICFVHRVYRDIMEASKTTTSDAKIQDAYLMKYYLPQNWECEISENLNFYTKLQYTSERKGRNQFYEILEKTLRDSGVRDEEIRYIQHHLKTEKTFQSTQENAILAPILKFLKKKIKNSAYLSELIVRMYYHDYRLFGFKIPDLKSIHFGEISEKK